MVCQQCKVAFCAKACSAGAIVKDERTGILVINEKSCTGCMDCVQACPFAALLEHADKKIPLKCDLCGGKPMCVKNCPSGALKYVTSDLVAH